MKKIAKEHERELAELTSQFPSAYDVRRGKTMYDSVFGNVDDDNENNDQKSSKPRKKKQKIFKGNPFDNETHQVTLPEDIIIRTPDRMFVARSIVSLENEKNNDQKEKFTNALVPHLAIYPVKGKLNDDWPYIGLPKPSFRWLFVAPTNTGKTTCIINVLKTYQHVFDNIFIFSNVLKLDRLWKEVLDTNFNKNNCFDSYSEEKLQEIVGDAVMEISTGDFLEKKDRKKILIIGDDIIDQIYNRHGKPSLMDKLYMRGRHIGFSVILTTQSYMLFPKTIRINADFLTVFKLRNTRESSGVWAEQAGHLSQREWLAIIRNIWREPFNFICFDHFMPEAQRLKWNFDRVVQPVEDEKDEKDEKNTSSKN